MKSSPSDKNNKTGSAMWPITLLDPVLSPMVPLQELRRLGMDEARKGEEGPGMPGQCWLGQTSLRSRHHCHHLRSVKFCSQNPRPPGQGRAGFPM